MKEGRSFHLDLEEACKALLEYVQRQNGIFGLAIADVNIYLKDQRVQHFVVTIHSNPETEPKGGTDGEKG